MAKRTKNTMNLIIISAFILFITSSYGIQIFIGKEQIIKQLEYDKIKIFSYLQNEIQNVSLTDG